MNKKYIAIFDSGIGGLSLLKILNEKVSGQNFLYLGDNKNVPYGNKSVKELKTLTFNRLSLFFNFPLKALIIGCNTLSTNILPDIRKYMNCKVFGVFPPLEKNVMAGNKVSLFATERTVSTFSDYPVKKVILKDLASDIERNKYNLNKVDLSVVRNSVGFDTDTVILGCTHYFFIKNNIFVHRQPLKIDSGEIYTANKVINELNLKKIDKNRKTARENQVFFLGENYNDNKRFWLNVVRDINI
ncbi:MAG: hypothetical protein IJR66_03865 [Clostridia bacterium]|nr:hypothetical protein [Clostridia bacterium]MBQ9514093.1 hypothetical protein [Clostridia bacterium]